ncbi:MAG: MBL fold metallo-hydrolase [Thermodesulfobacteriota bacterium]
MRIKIWGSRGSIVSPGQKTLRYGGESTCLELTSDTGQKIVIDAGSGIRKLGHELLKDKTVSSINLLLTHSHWDHLTGFPFFSPAYLPGFSIVICGCSMAQQSILKYLAHLMEPPYFPVAFEVLNARFDVGCICTRELCDHILPHDSSIMCHSLPLNHPNGGYGFKFVDKDKTFVFLTDNEIRYHHETGLSRKAYLDFCGNVGLLFHDAQYTEAEYDRTRSWGHSTFKDAVDLAMEAEVKRLGLFHHDPDRSDEEIDHQVDWCREYILKSGSSLECFACAEGMEFVL